MLPGIFLAYRWIGPWRSGIAFAVPGALPARFAPSPGSTSRKDPRITTFPGRPLSGETKY
jgi:hypothetical protein